MLNILKLFIKSSSSHKVSVPQYPNTKVVSEIMIKEPIRI
jgi:hypothetical protein